MQTLHFDPFGIYIINEGVISNRPVTSLGHPNFAAGLMLLVLPFTLSELNKNNFFSIRLLIPLLLAAGIFVTQSRGAYAAFVAEILVYFMLYPIFIKNDKNAGKIFIIGLFIIGFIIIIITALLVFAPGFEYSIRIAKILDPANDARWLLWRDSLNVFIKYPLTGTGLGQFAAIFENIISMQLRKMEILSYYDNPHNNFLAILCTMGLAGLITYILLLLQGIRLSIKAIKTNLNENKKLYFYAIFTAICGYIVYGITNFDDICILLYMFIIFAMLKALYIKDKVIFPESKINKQKYIITSVLMVIIACAGFNIYSTYLNLKANRFYREGIDAFSYGDYKSSVQFLDNAILLNYTCPEYKLTLAQSIIT